MIPPTLTYNNIQVSVISKSQVAYDGKGSYYFAGNNTSDINIDITNNLVIYAGYGGGWSYNIQINSIIEGLLLKEEGVSESYISIHFRNTDLKNNINQFIAKLRALYYRSGISTVYFASDDCNSYDIFVKWFPYLKFIRKTIPEPNITNLHYSSKNKFEEIYNCIRDIFFIVKSSYFIPSYNSGLSRMIIEQIRNKNLFFPNIISRTQIH